MRPVIIAIDFDGPIVKLEESRNLSSEDVISNPYHFEAEEHAIQSIKTLKEYGYELILWTCRTDCRIDEYKRHLYAAESFLEFNGVLDCFTAINDQHPWVLAHPLHTVMAKKVFADVYVDDRNAMGWPGWHKILRWILRTYPIEQKDSQELK